jgi:hypothetical protein
MRPAAYNLECVQGDDFEQSFRLRNKTTQEPLVLTSWTGTAQVRNTNAQKDLMTTMAVTINHAVAPGLVLCTIESEITETMPVGTYMWDLELKDNAGKKRTWLSGTFTILDQVTKPGLS